MKLPSKQELPDYYNIIKKPIDIKKIQQRLEENKVNFEVEHAVGTLGHVDCALGTLGHVDYALGTLGHVDCTLGTLGHVDRTLGTLGHVARLWCECYLVLPVETCSSHNEQ
jgi:hypothetical protein